MRSVSWPNPRHPHILMERVCPPALQHTYFSRLRLKQTEDLSLLETLREEIFQGRVVSRLHFFTFQGLNECHIITAMVLTLFGNFIF
jgi:hypothetical protein